MLVAGSKPVHIEEFDFPLMRPLFRESKRKSKCFVNRPAYCQGKLNKGNFGRDHHPRCYSMWMAGGGVKGGTTYGETDPLSYNVASNGVHVHDLNATILHLLGIDHERLTYKYQGRRFRLTDVEGELINGILA